MQRAGCSHKSRGSPKIDRDFSALLRDFRGNIKRGSKLFIKLVYVLFAGSISSAPLGFPLLVFFNVISLNLRIMECQHGKNI
jgi:hypothetical protein